MRGLRFGNGSRDVATGQIAFNTRAERTILSGQFQSLPFGVGRKRPTAAKLRTLKIMPSSTTRLDCPGNALARGIAKIQGGSKV
jgi:hypothetical protein